MADSSDQKSRLPDKIVASLAREVFSYDAKFAELSEKQLLKLSDALDPYYPLSNDENLAALTLREWLTAREVEEESSKALRTLEDMAALGLREWRDIVQRWYHENEYRQKRRNHEESDLGMLHKELYYERNPEMLHKELYYELKSGDPRSLIMAMERLIEDAITKNMPRSVGAPPQVVVSDALANAAKGVTDDTRKNLATYVVRVANAKQLLSRYLHKIVATEGIQPISK